jgi:hypothetical protein
MARGLDVGIYLRPGLDDERFVAQTLGNLAAFDLAQQRRESLQWQVLAVHGSRAHHYRLVIRHPERILDLGLKRDLSAALDRLSGRSVAELRSELETATSDGMRLVALRDVQDDVDFWQDDFWNWIGGPFGAGPIPP